jgi:predicted metal-binding transcription factor (methanogenesis marker protein 9)
MDPDHHQKNSINVCCQPLRLISIYTAIYTAQIITKESTRKRKRIRKRGGGGGGGGEEGAVAAAAETYFKAIIE